MCPDARRLPPFRLEKGCARIRPFGEPRPTSSLVRAANAREYMTSTPSYDNRLPATTQAGKLRGVRGDPLRTGRSYDAPPVGQHAELLTGGVITATVTAASVVAKAKIEANTQRLKNAQDAENTRRKIEADERTRAIQAAAQVESARQQASPPTS